MKNRFFFQSYIYAFGFEDANLYIYSGDSD